MKPSNVQSSKTGQSLNAFSPEEEKKKKINKASKWDIQGYYAGPAPKYEHLYNH